MSNTMIAEVVQHMESLPDNLQQKVLKVLYLNNAEKSERATASEMRESLAVG